MTFIRRHRGFISTAISLVTFLIAVSIEPVSVSSSQAQTGSAMVTRPAAQSPRRPRSARQRGMAKAISERQQQIARIVEEIDAGNIERTIRKLVSFGTRNTLSAQNDPNRGIGAARDWLFSEFSKVAEQSGGRMTIEKQSFEQPKAARVPEPTTITNVVATLREPSLNQRRALTSSVDITIRCALVRRMPRAMPRAQTTTLQAQPPFWKWRA